MKIGKIYPRAIGALMIFLGVIGGFTLSGCASRSDQLDAPQGISGDSDRMWDIHSRTMNNVFR